MTGSNGFLLTARTSVRPLGLFLSVIIKITINIIFWPANAKPKALNIEVKKGK